jgi:CelD/BcsL family acetyltransferase involved in cellulose biosynthesis
VSLYPNNEPLEVGVLTSTQGFAAIEEEWEDLYHSSPLATPFQSWAWLYSWWEFYGEGHELRLLTVRNGEGLLVGIIPLMLERRRGLGRMLFIGTGLTDHHDMLARTGWEDEVSEAGSLALRQMDSWQLADLQQLRPDAAAWGILRRWDGPRIRVWQDGCPVVDVKPWNELLTSLSRNLRSTVRRTLRRAEADGVRRKTAEETNAEEAAQRLVALHREAWQERDIGLEHLTQRFESCIVTAARRMMARRCGGISEFWRDGEVIISSFWMSGRDFFGTYMLGASQEALERYQWSSLYIWDAIDLANSKSAGYLDLLRGEEPYKLRWSTRVVPNHRLILGRRWILWLPYAGYHELYSRARRYANREGTPRWVRNAADGYRALRHKAAQLAGRGRS